MIEENKRIAKNTVYLYFQQFIVLAISLYTSRVVLNVLGATDYGLYNVVGGVITLFSFITSALSNSSSRYLTYAIGTNDENEIKRTFGTFLTVYYSLALLILIVGETVGLWFVYNHLNIPEDRFVASLWVYHLSIVSAVLNIIYIPHSGLVVAHERMRVFAYISILDAILKLVIALTLSISPIDKLVFYAVLVVIAQLINRFVYIIYCKKKFPEASTSFVYDKSLFSSIVKYSGWVLFGSLAYTTYTQGLNVLLNMFFGPIVNAARSISVQIQAATQNFIVGFQTAMYPQIVKSYAQKNLNRMYLLLHTVCKGSFFLFFLLGLPFLLKTSFILELWLKNVPDYTVPFTCCILLFSMLRSITNEINHAVQATGDIKKFQLCDGFMGLMVLPIAYVSLKMFHTNPVSVFIILVIVELVTVIVRIRIGIPKIGDSVSDFIRDVIFPICYVSLIGCLLPVIVSLLTDDCFKGFLLVCLSEIIWTIPSIFFLGLNRYERNYCIERIAVLINKYLKKK